MVKLSGGRRESEGPVVPLIGVQHNAPGGKGPHFDHVCSEGKREGMTGTARFNYPGGASPVVVDGHASVAKVRKLPHGLWTAAKQSPERRCHALYDRIHRGDVLWEAWDRVGAKRGSTRVDRVTLAFVERDYGVGRLLGELQASLRAGTYHPAPARRVDIPKPQGGVRPLGMPAVRARVVQQAAKIVLEPVFEADFAPCSFGFRPKRSAMQAMKRLRGEVRERTDRRRSKWDIRDVIADLNPVLRGWNNDVRTGNAANKVRTADPFVVWRLHGLMVKKRGRNLRGGQQQERTEEWFNGLGLYRLRGTIRYPKTA